VFINEAQVLPAPSDPRVDPQHVEDHVTNDASELIAQFDADLKQAMRDRDATTKLTLRSVKTALTEASKESEDHTLTQDTVLAVLQKQAKLRREAALEYEKAGATGRMEAELAELAVLQRYLPKQLSESEVEAMARAVIAETGATSQKDLGKVMSPLMARIAGRADGKLVNSVVRSLLNP
jgi:hypothetical protein